MNPKRAKGSSVSGPPDQAEMFNQWAIWYGELCVIAPGPPLDLDGELCVEVWGGADEGSFEWTRPNWHPAEKFERCNPDECRRLDKEHGLEVKRAN